MQIVFNGADGTDVTVDHAEVLGSIVRPGDGCPILLLKDGSKMEIKEPPRQVAEVVNECFGLKLKREVKFGPTHIQYCSGDSGIDRFKAFYDK